jgi:hypothetical protein
MDTPTTPATSDLNHHMNEVNRLLQRLTEQALGSSEADFDGATRSSVHTAQSTKVQPSHADYFQLSHSQPSLDGRTPSPTGLSYTQLATSSTISYEQLQQQNADLTVQLRDAIGVLETARTFMCV